MEKTGSLEIIPENCPLDPKGRLSISLDDQNVSSPSSCGSPSGAGVVKKGGLTSVAEVELRMGSMGLRGSTKDQQQVLRGQEVKSYSCLPQVGDFFSFKHWHAKGNFEIILTPR